MPERAAKETEEGPGGQGALAGAGGGKRKGRRGLPLLLAAAVVMGALAVMAVRGTRVVTDDAYVEARVYRVQTRVPSTVLEVLVEDDQHVESGRLLVRLDPEEPRIQVRQAEAALEGARLQYEEALIAARAAEAERNLAGARLEQAAKDLARIEALWSKRTVSEDRYDNAVTRHRVLASESRVAEERRRLSLARIETGRSAVDLAAERLAEARVRLGYTEIRAPGPGMVSKKDVEPGQVVPAGYPLMALVDLGDVWVKANFKETQLRRIRPGARAEVRVDSFPGTVLPAVVESIEAGTGAAFSLFPPENATGNWVKIVQRVPVKVALDREPPDESAPRLRVGMSAEVTVRTEDQGPLARIFSFLPGL